MTLDSIYRISGGGSVKKERKGGLLMHASIFCRFFSLPYLILSFLFVLLLSVFSSYPPSWVLPSFIMATSPFFILLHSIGFLPFVPKASPTVFGFLWASFRITH